MCEGSQCTKSSCNEGDISTSSFFNAVDDVKKREVDGARESERREIKITSALVKRMREQVGGGEGGGGEG